MYNKRSLSKDTKASKAPKSISKPRDIIVDPMGQWKYPGQNTRIPGNDITMKGVNYPVLGVGSDGQQQMMYPGQDYKFPGAEYVDEYPQMRKGGGLKSKKYSRDLEATNQVFHESPLFKKKKSKKKKIYHPKAKHFQTGGEKTDEWGRYKGDPWYGFNPDTNKFTVSDPWGRKPGDEWYGFNQNSHTWEKGKKASQQKENEALQEKRFDALYGPVEDKVFNVIGSDENFYALPSGTYNAIEQIYGDWGLKRNIPPLDPVLEEMQQKLLSLSEGQIKKLLNTNWSGMAGLANLATELPDNISYKELYRYYNHINKLKKQGYTLQKGGVPYNYNPFVSTEPEVSEQPQQFTPIRTENDPEDYDQFLSYSQTAPENRRPTEGYTYGDPNDYDHYGMWDALGKPKDFNQALEMNPDWTPDPYDGYYHGFSVNPNTGVFLKSGKPGLKPGDTTWMEVKDHYLSDRSNSSNLTFNPDLQRFQYTPNENYIETELTPEEIQQYKDGGYIVEELNDYKAGGSLLTKKVTCKNCGWKWDAADGGDDVTTCHKCGGQGLVHAKKGRILKRKQTAQPTEPIQVYSSHDEAFPLPTGSTVSTENDIKLPDPFTIKDPVTGQMRPMTEEEKAIKGRTFMQDWAISPMAKSMLENSIAADAPYGDLNKFTDAISNLRYRATAGNPTVTTSTEDSGIGETRPNYTAYLRYDKNTSPYLDWEDAEKKGMATIIRTPIPGGGLLQDYTGTRVVGKTLQDQLNAKKFSDLKDQGKTSEEGREEIYLENLDKMGVEDYNTEQFTQNLGSDPTFYTLDRPGEHAYVYPHEYSHNQDMGGTLLPFSDLDKITEYQGAPLVSREEWTEIFNKYYNPNEDWDRESFNKEIADVISKNYAGSNAYLLDKQMYENDFNKFKRRYDEVIDPNITDNTLTYDEFLNKSAKPDFYLNQHDYKGYIDIPTETRARLNAMRMYGQEYGVYNPFHEKLTPEKFQELIKIQEQQNPGIPDANQLQQLRRSYSDEEILDMLNTISKNDNSSGDQLNMAQKGGTRKAIGISDPAEYAYRKAAYDDSLWLYNKNLEQFKIPKIEYYDHKNKKKLVTKLKPVSWIDKVIVPKTQKEKEHYYTLSSKNQLASPFYNSYYDAYQDWDNYDIETGKSNLKKGYKDIPVNYPEKIIERKYRTAAHAVKDPKTGKYYGMTSPWEKEGMRFDFAVRYKKPVQPVYKIEKSENKGDKSSSTSNKRTIIEEVPEVPVTAIPYLPLRPIESGIPASANEVTPLNLPLPEFKMTPTTIEAEDVSGKRPIYKDEPVYGQRSDGSWYIKDYKKVLVGYETVGGKNYNRVPLDEKSMRGYRHGGVSKAQRGIIVHDRTDPRLLAYNDSLQIFNASNKGLDRVSKGMDPFDSYDIFERTFKPANAWTADDLLYKGPNSGILMSPSSYALGDYKWPQFTKPVRKVTYEEPIPELKVRPAEPIEIDLPDERLPWTARPKQPGYFIPPASVTVWKTAPDGTRYSVQRPANPTTTKPMKIGFYEKGGMTMGQEIDLTPEQEAHLRSLGYKLERL